MRDVEIKTLLTGSNTYLWQKQGETNVRDSFGRREEKYTHPPVMKLLSSSRFPRNRRGGFGSALSYKVMIERESFLLLMEEMKLLQTCFRVLVGQFVQLRLCLICQMRHKLNLSAITVDVGDVTHNNHRDWLMSLFAVWKFIKISLYPKIKHFFLQHDFHILCENTCTQGPTSCFFYRVKKLCVVALKSRKSPSVIKVRDLTIICWSTGVSGLQNGGVWLWHGRREGSYLLQGDHHGAQTVDPSYICECT